MKRILFLLLLTVSVYGQNPSRFAKIQITGNTNSGTATKVNVQEANGEVNTQTINTGFNKNIGLGGSDVVGANTLLNQYATTPSDWTAQSYVLNSVVFYAGKQWIAKIATVAGDVPAVSSKWEEITFEALANKTTTVDQTIIDGSTNAVSGNAVFDALATKAPISSVHNPVTLGTANGLSLSTQQLSLGLASSGVTGALSGTDWNTFNNKQNALTNPITGTGVAGQISFWSGTGTQISDSGLTWDGTNGLVSKKQIILDAQNIAFIIGNYTPTNFAQIYYNSVNKALQFTRSDGIDTIVVKDVTGNVGINQVLPTEKLDVVGNGKFSGTISASPATTANQVVVKSQLDAVAASSGTYTPSNQTNATQTVNFIRSYWEKNGNVLTVTTSLTYTVTQIQSTASFLITLPNGFLVSGANGRIIGSSLLHITHGIFNNNANMKAYEASDSSQINLQANFQATVSSGTYETTIIYTVLIQ